MPNVRANNHSADGGQLVGVYTVEVTAMCVISQFTDSFGEKLAVDYPALFMIYSLPRFANCTLFISRASGRVGRDVPGDWVRTVGNPRRIIADRGCPGSPGKYWADLSHVFGRQIIRAPEFRRIRTGLRRAQLDP